MWKIVLQILTIIFLVFGSVQSYINNEGIYSNRGNVNPKSSYLNYELSRFRNRYSTSTEKHKSFRNFDHKIRHTNNRFPKMDSLLSRIANQNHELTTVSSLDNKNNKKWITEGPYYRRYPHRTNSTNSLRLISTTTSTTQPYEADYEDIEMNTEKKIQDETEQESQDSEEEDDDDTTDDDEEEEDEDDDQSEDWQAEEATEEPTERSLTDYKWKHFGTRSRVEESRRNHGITNNNLRQEVYEAVEHARRVNLAGACRVPRVRLIRVQHVYPDAGKAYIPHCTLLHRCSDDTGCCRSDTLTCAPKNTARVELHFYTGRPGSYSVEKLAFYNHTECHCVERSQEMMSRDAEDDSTVEDRYPLRPGGNVKSGGGESYSQPAPEPIRRCRCPELFTPQVTHGHCRCECQEGHRDCMRIKRGKEYFSLKDRLCIQKQECGYPACEFGVYIRFSGRCPRKQEKLEAFSRITPQ